MDERKPRTRYTGILVMGDRIRTVERDSEESLKAEMAFEIGLFYPEANANAPDGEGAAGRFSRMTQFVLAAEPTFQWKIIDRGDTWDGTLNILGLTYRLDQVNLDIQNHCRLPRYLLFRQVYWGEGAERRPGSELFLEMMFMGSIISQRASARYIARECAENHPSDLWTLVELDWYNDSTEKGPHIADISVYDSDGNYVDSAARDRAARFAARAARKAQGD